MSENNKKEPSSTAMEMTFHRALLQRGFKQIQDSSEEYKEVYFHGKNEDREACSIYSFVYAMVG